MVLAAPAAMADVTVYVDGQQVQFDQQPYVDSDAKRTLVPFRQIFEALGANVWYDETTNSAMGRKGSLTIQLPIGQTKAIVNGNSVDLDVAPQVVNGRTMVPLRFVSENLGCEVRPEGDLTNLTIHITSTVTPQPTPQLAPQPAPAQPVATSGKYVGSAKSDKYHYPSCRHAQKITTANTVWFKDAADARAHGHVPCGVCKP